MRIAENPFTIPQRTPHFPLRSEKGVSDEKRDMSRHPPRDDAKGELGQNRAIIDQDDETRSNVD